MLYFPPLPDVPTAHTTEGKVYLRYEDVAEDGRVMVTSLPQALGMVVWRHLVGPHPITTELRPRGIIPILTRVYARGGDGTVSVGRPLRADGSYLLAHVAGDGGAPERIRLDMWAELRGHSGKTYGPPPPDKGAPVSVGTVYAEHVFTRLFAPPDQRKVLSLPGDELPTVPEAVVARRAPAEAMALPEGAAWIEDAASPVEGAVAFGVDHTDSNQHINSLVYPRLFIDAALRRLAGLGRSTTVLAREMEIAYRKPCFAGDTMRVVLRAFEQGGRVGAAGAYYAADDAADPERLAAARPHCCARVVFDAP